MTTPAARHRPRRAGRTPALRHSDHGTDRPGSIRTARTDCDIVSAAQLDRRIPLYPPTALISNAAAIRARV